MKDDPGQPEKEQEHYENGIATDAQRQAEQQTSLTTAQAAKVLGVDSRTMRRWIEEGRLPGRWVQKGRNAGYQVLQSDLEEFRHQRERAATEGKPMGGQLMRGGEESQALTTSAIHIIAGELERKAAELERRELALAEAQKTIERLSYDSGRQAGINEAQAGEIEALRQRVAELEQERDLLRQKAQESGKTPPRRIRLLPWQKEE